MTDRIETTIESRLPQRRFGVIAAFAAALALATGCASPPTDPRSMPLVRPSMPRGTADSSTRIRSTIEKHRGTSSRHRRCSRTATTRR